jgi:glutathione S-transferase
MLTLISHHLCPYVQRAAIALAEKDVRFERIYVDLANKPAWFRTLSPLGKTPVLKVGDTPLFESAVILEYLDETAAPRLHPEDPLERAVDRAWIEVSSSVLNDIAGLYSAPDRVAFDAKAETLALKLARADERLGEGPNFGGATFSLVDAAWAPVFRYFDVFDDIPQCPRFASTGKLARWRSALAARGSVRTAVTSDYPERLRAFLMARRSHLSQLMELGAGHPSSLQAHG